ncbi:MAG: cation:proton antiporter [Bacillota bacterium]
MLKSIVLIVACGVVIKQLLKALRIPPLLGLIAGGLLLGPYVGNILDADFLKFSPEIRLLALVMILLRAGLGLNFNILKRIVFSVLKISLLPCLLEAATVFMISFYWIGLNLVEAGMLSFIIAAVSPALIVPSMLDLREQGIGMNKGIPLIILAGASVDNVLAVTLFSVFSAMAVSARHLIVLDLVLIPVKIAGGILLGLLIGLLLIKVFTKFSLQKTDEIALVICGAIFAVLIGEAVSLAGLLAVMAIGFVLAEKSRHRSALFNGSMLQIWLIAELFLFILIGTEINIAAMLGSIGPGLIIVVSGLTARTAGVFLATAGSALTVPERLFCAISFWPKATVQAALGGLPLALGMPHGEAALAIAVLAIIITTPIGAWGIKLGAARLLDRSPGSEAAKTQHVG